MLRLLMIVSGAFEALFGIAAILATSMVTDALGTTPTLLRYFSRGARRGDIGHRDCRAAGA